jgi:predicted choloylglycine hydrolase
MITRQKLAFWRARAGLASLEKGDTDFGYGQASSEAQMFMFSWRMTVLFLTALLALSSVLHGEDAFRYPEGRFGNGELRYVNGVPVLIVRGSHRAMGEQIGKLALKPAARIAGLINSHADASIHEAMRPVADLAARSMYARFPREYREELEAMAAAANVDLSPLILANTIIDLWEMMWCSSVVVSPNRSGTGGPLYGHNVDAPYVKGLAELSVLIVYHPEEGHAFAAPTLPGCLMFFSGMNSKGLALGSQGVGAPKDGSARFNPTGEPSAVVGRRLLERCASVDEAQRWLEQHRMARGVSIAACDRTRQCVLEVTTERVLVRSEDDGFCCATNHFRHRELGGGEKCSRYEALEEGRRKDRLGIQEVAALMKAANQGRMTIHTMVFEPATLVMHLAMGPGPATDYPLKRIALSELFDQRLPSPARGRGAGGEGTTTGEKLPTSKSAAPGESKPVRRVAGVVLGPDGSPAQPGASASDYDKIERRLVKEPVYQTKSPKYALLLFGPQMGLRVWIVMDGEILYVDRNGNGDLTEPGERFDKEASCKDVEIADPDRVTKYVIKKVSSDYSTYTPEARQKRTAEGIPPALLVTVEIQGQFRYWQYCDVQQMRDAPQKAMIAHFHGPLTVGPRTINWRLPTSTALHFGNQPDMLAGVIGTMDEKHGCWVVVQTHEGDKCLFPEGVRPVAVVEFPPKDRNGTTVKKCYHLDKFCCRGQFFGPVQVPPEAGLGKAKVTFSFETWTEGRARPSTAELPVVDSEVPRS